MSFWEKLFSGRMKTRASSPLPAIPAGTGLAEIMSEDLTILFKHSSSCPVSWAAHAQVSRFFQENPEAPVRIVSVTRERPLSQQIAAATGIRHESPQILVLRRGEVVASASHGEITRDRLNLVYRNARDPVAGSANSVADSAERVTQQ